MTKKELEEEVRQLRVSVDRHMLECGQLRTAQNEARQWKKKYNELHTSFVTVTTALAKRR